MAAPNTVRQPAPSSPVHTAPKVEETTNGNGAGRGKRKDRSEIQKQNLALLKATKNLYEACRDFENGEIDEKEYMEEVSYWGGKVERNLPADVS